MSQPARYEGLPLEWARAWMRRHGRPKQQPDNFMLRRLEIDADSMQGRYEKRERKRVTEARRRWMQRRWKVSRKGNPYTKLRHIRAVIYAYGPVWRFFAANTITGEEIRSNRSYSTIEDAKAASFDVVLYLRSKSQSAHPSLTIRQEGETPYESANA